MISRNEATKNWEMMLYGLASLIDGIIMIMSVGFLLSSFRGQTSLWVARRELRRAPAVRLQPASPPRGGEIPE